MDTRNSCGNSSACDLQRRVSFHNILYVCILSSNGTPFLSYRICFLHISSKLSASCQASYLLAHLPCQLLLVLLVDESSCEAGFSSSSLVVPRRLAVFLVSPSLPTEFTQTVDGSSSLHHLVRNSSCRLTVRPLPAGPRSLCTVHKLFIIGARKIGGSSHSLR